MLGVGRRTIYDWIKSGKLMAVKVGGKIIRIPENEINKLIHRVEIKDKRMVEPDYTNIPREQTGYMGEEK